MKMTGEPSAVVARRTLLVGALAGAGLLVFPMPVVHSSQELLIANVTRLYPVRVAHVVVPMSTEDVRREVKTWKGQIAVGGGRYSMGGQIAVTGGLHIDMRQMNRLIWLRPKDKVVRVQAGMRWRDLQDHIDPHGLSVRTMQSYANFTVGGSASVNVHGRYVGNGPMSGSIVALQLVLASGEVVEASRHQRPELFRAAIGGYGAVGVITEVELALDANTRLERNSATMALEDYVGYFEKKVKGASSCVLHNADLLPPRFDQATAVSWVATTKPLTVAQRLIPRGQSYALEQKMIWAVTELPKGDDVQRKIVRPALLSKPTVVWRNYEASLDTNSLEPRSRSESTYVLQEYFVPTRNFLSFAREMATIFQKRRAQVLNVSVRHSPADADSIMSWAREEVFSFVIYYKQRVSQQAMNAVGGWTRELIDAALKNEGTYYLPYQRHATQAQFDAAYPQAAVLRQIKAKVDPKGRMTNELWRQYL